MEKVKSTKNIDEFGIKKGEVFNVKLDYDLKPYIEVKRKCYLTKRIQKKEFEVQG